MNTVTHWEKKFFYTTTIAIIPRAVVPELDNVIANLELMPLRMNESKSATAPTVLRLTYGARRAR